MGIPAQYHDQKVWVMSGYGRMAHKTQFWGYLKGIQAQYWEMVGELVMCGVRTCLGGWYGGGGFLGPFEDSPYRGRELLIWGKERRSFDALHTEGVA